jgi:hypothetical protein
VPPRAVLAVLLAILAAILPASAAVALPARAPAKPVTRACALLRGPEISAVLGANPGRGRRDRSYCRYEPLPDLTLLITGLFPDSGRETIDGARRVAESLGGTVEDVDGVGTAAIWEPEKGQLSVASRRGNVFEVQVISDGDPAVVRQQAVDLAGVVLAHRRA